MNRKKLSLQLTALFLALVVVLSLLPATVVAVSAEGSPEPATPGVVISSAPAEEAPPAPPEASPSFPAVDSAEPSLPASPTPQASAETPPDTSPTPSAAPDSQPSPQPAPTSLSTPEPSIAPQPSAPDLDQIIKDGLRLFALPLSDVADYTGGNIYRYTLKPPSPLLSEGFSSAKITIFNQKDGYNKTDTGTDRNVKFHFEVTMDDDFLYRQIETISQRIDYPMQGRTESDDDYEQRVNHYLNALTDVPPLVFSYDLGSDFNKCPRQEGTITDAGGKNFGTYVLEQGIVSVHFFNETYAYQGVYATFSFEVQLDDDATLDDDDIEAAFKDGRVIQQSVGSTGGGSGGDGPLPYGLEKQGPARVTTSVIDYTLSLLSPPSEKPLNEMILVDRLPQGLDVQSVMLDGVLLDESAYSVVSTSSGRDLQYVFPSEAEIGKKTTAEFVITLALDRTEYQTLVDTNKYNKTFSNQAELREAGKDKPLATSNSIETQMNLSFLQKTGSQENLKGTRFSWTVDANTRLPHLEYGYLVDQLCSGYHQYDFDSGITVVGKSGTTVYSNANGNITRISGSIPWETLTAENLKTLVGSATGAVYYEYDSTEPNPFYVAGGAEPEFLQLGVLVLPFTGLQGTAQEANVQIKYSTNINLHGMSVDNYLLHAASKSVVVSNVVNLLWKNRAGGNGPGPAPQPDIVNFGKRVDTAIDILDKKGVSYDPKTRKLSWKLTVNKLGADLSDIKVTDVLPQGVYNSGSIQVSYVKYDTLAEDFVVSGGALSTDPAQPAYYALIPPEKDADGKLEIFIKEPLPPQYYYSFNVSLQLEDPTLLSKQGIGKLSNTATIDALIDGSPKNSSLTAQLSIPNTLIKKRAVQSYNYITNEIYWEVEVNPNSLNIQNAAIADTLPIGTGFKVDQLTNVKVDGIADPTLLQAVKNGVSINGDIVTFPLGNITKPVVLEFATTVTDAFRNSAEFLDSGTQFLNLSELTGNILNSYGVSAAITNATAQAVQTVRSGHMVKSGKYNKDQGCIDWDVLINVDQKNIFGTSFLEQLYLPSENPIHELRVGSLKLYEMTLRANGSAEVAQDVTANLPAYGLSESPAGFRFDFPDAGSGSNSKVYRVTFTTDLTGSDPNATIKNVVYLKGAGDVTVDESNTSNGGYSGGFDATDAAGRNPRPKVSITKSSSNSVQDPGKSGLLLDGAVFDLEAYSFTGDIENGIQVNSSGLVKKYGKVRLTSDGLAVFLNVMAGDHFVYRLQETQAPAGYALDSTPQFFLFPTVASAFDKVTVTETIGSSTKTYSDQPVINPTTDDKGNPLYANAQIALQNVPLAGSGFHFTKQQPDRYSYDSSKETVTYRPLAGAIFRLEPQGDLKDKVTTQYATSDASGQVNFPALDAGTYRLTELKSGSSLAVGASCTLTVAWDATLGQYTHTLGSVSGSGLKFEKDISDQYIATNDYLRSTVSITKLAAFADSATFADGARNAERLAGTTFTLVGKTDGSLTDNYTKTTGKTDVNGKVSFYNVPPGTYTLSETTAPDGYVKSTAAYAVVITEKDTTSVIGEYPAGTKHYGKTTEVTITPSVHNPATLENEINNRPVHGSISFTKTAYWGATGLVDLNAKHLDGVRFGLFRRIVTTDGKGVPVTYDATTPTYEAVSDASGDTTFSRVEYGDYILKEIDPPKGYQPFSMEIKRTSLGASGETPFAYVISAPVQNIVRRLPALDFFKVTSDEAPVSNVGFTLFRRGDIVSPTGSGLVLDVPAAAISYGRYQPTSPGTALDTIQSDGNGAFHINDLPIGDYLLLETVAPPDLQSGFTRVALGFTVQEKANSGDCEVVGMRVCEQLSYAASPVDLSGSITPATGNTWKEIDPISGKYKIINYLKFASVQINKVFANRTSGAPVSTGQIKGAATFEITLDGQTTPYFTLKTDPATGRFVQNANGTYTDALSGKEKYLYYGSYTLRETVPPAGAVIDSNSYAFRLADGTTGHQGTAWVRNSGTPVVTYVPAGGSEPDPAQHGYFNLLSRGTVSLKKLADDDSSLLSGAQFILYAGSTPVASLKEQAGPIYLLSNAKASGGVYAASDSVTGQPYLYESDGIWRLLSGTYTIKESVPPSGYAPIPDFTIQIDASGNVTVGAAAAGYAQMKDGVIELKNKIIKTPLQFVKYDQDGTLQGATFRLTNVEGTHTYATSDASGSVLFPDLVYGTYTLKESSAPSGYATGKSVVTVNVDALGVLSIINGSTPVTIAELETLMRNQKTMLRIAKQDEQNHSVSGVTLQLSGNFTDNTNTRIWVTDGTTPEYKGLLIGGETYTLSETRRVAGYLSAHTAVFRMELDGSITPISGFAANQNTLTQQDGAPMLILRDLTIQGSIELRKSIPAGQQDYSGITFDLYRSKQAVDIDHPTDLPTPDPSADVKVNTAPITLDAAGKATLRSLSEGYYYLLETGTRNDLCFAPQPSEVVYLGPAQHAAAPVVIAMQNEALNAGVELKKVDAVDGAPISGTQFTLYRTSGTTPQACAQGITDGDGVLRLPIPGKGRYQLRETQPARGYQLDPAAAFTADFAVGNSPTFQNSVLDLTAEPAQNVIDRYNLTLNHASYRNEGLTNPRQPGTLTLRKQDAADASALNGVTFTLYKKSDSTGIAAFWDFITGNTYTAVDEQVWTQESGEAGSLQLRNLAWGEYRIEETGWPQGYRPPTDVTFDFTIGKTATEVVLDVALGSIQNERTQLLLSKVTPNGRYIAGAQLKLAGKFADGSSEVKWISDAQPKEFLGQLLPNEQYRLTEESAPAGYQPIREALVLEMDANGDLIGSADNHYALVNQPITVRVQKFSPQGQPLKGCVFRVSGVFAPLPTQLHSVQKQESIIVDDAHPDALVGRMIPGNEYLLQEMTAPHGYVVGGSVRFTVNETGVIQMLDHSTEYVVDENGNIRMTNDPTTMKFAKVDPDGKFLDGVVLRLDGRLANGKTSHTIMPGTKGAVALDELLIEGERYTLSELTAPAGYQLIETPIVFDFLPGNLVKLAQPNEYARLTSVIEHQTIPKTIFTLSIRNQPIVSPDPPPNDPAGGQSPKTGDERPLLPWLILACSAALVPVLLIQTRKRRKR